jgi:CDP-diacylglycerol--glycerol-3-phosphate 3-phosphatidyltransferase
MVPIFMLVMFLIPGEHWIVRNAVAAAIFLGTAITDAIDGNLARKHNMITEFGKFIDPLADKFLVIFSMLMLLYVSGFESIRPYMLWVFAAVVMRELAVTALRLVLRGSGVVLAADMLGKVKTVFQIIFVMTALLEPILYFVLSLFLPVPSEVWSFLSAYPVLTLATMACTLFFTVVSGINYFVKNGKHLDPEK